MSASRKTHKKQAHKSCDFEKSLQQLNQLVEKMETGQLSLEASLQCFEEGILIIRQCQQTLQAAEQKVRILTNNRPLASP